MDPIIFQDAVVWGVPKPTATNPSSMVNLSNFFNASIFLCCILFIYFRNKLTFCLYKNKNIMPEFFKTRMGHKFYDADIPRLTFALEKIGHLLETLNEREDKKWKLEEKLKRIELKDKLNEADRTKG
jgi:hypothetical protein